MLKMTDSFEILQNWVLNSGLVIVDKNSKNLGGVCSFFDEKKNEYGFIYPEITGYFLSSLRFLNSLNPNSDYQQLANNSSKWLMQIEKEHGGIIQGIGSDISKQKLVYSFDTGICAKGFLDSFELTQNSEYKEYARKLLDWLIDEAIENDGTIKPLKDLSSNTFQTSKDVWYKQKGCLHIKLAMPFLHLYKLTNEKNLLETADLICSNYKKLQNADGSFSLHFGSNIIHLHTMCYALEGLIYAYSVTKNIEYLESVERGLEWCSKNIEHSDGSIPLWFNAKHQSAKTSYHIAQIIRIMILVDSLHKSQKFEKDIKLLNSFLISLQASSKNNVIEGGFYEEYFKSFLGWKKRLRLNSWGSMFALQALKWDISTPFEQQIEFLY